MTPDQGERQTLDFVRRGDRDIGIGLSSLHSGSSQDHSHFWGFNAISFKNFPHLQQQLRTANDSTIVHIPFLIHRPKLRNLINEGLEPTAEVQGTQRVTLLNS